MGCLIIILCLVLLITAPVFLVAVLLWPAAAILVAEMREAREAREARDRQP